MIRKLFSLFWALFTTKDFKYNWTNLWWYLTKGYTLSDVQDSNIYLLSLARNFILDLYYYKKDLGLVDDIDGFEHHTLYNLINIYLSREFDYLKLSYQKEVIQDLKENLKEVLDLGI